MEMANFIVSLPLPTHLFIYLFIYLFFCVLLCELTGRLVPMGHVLMCEIKTS